MIARRLSNQSFGLVKTCDDGACGLHVIFGRSSGTDVLQCPHACVFAVSLLGPDIANVRLRCDPGQHLQQVVSSIWNKLLLDRIRGSVFHGSSLFFQALHVVDPELYKVLFWGLFRACICKCAIFLWAQ